MSVRIGIVDTGVNPWHSHVTAPVSGCRLWVDDLGNILEDGDFFDTLGHGTAVAGVICSGLPDVVLFSVRVFGDDGKTYPSLVARGILEAVRAGCRIVVLSLSTTPGPGCEVLVAACHEACRSGSLLVASGDPRWPDRLPASHPDVTGVCADPSLGEWECQTDRDGAFPVACYGGPRELAGVPREVNLWGHSFACARYAVHLARSLWAIPKHS